MALNIPQLNLSKDTFGTWVAKFNSAIKVLDSQDASNWTVNFSNTKYTLFEYLNGVTPIKLAAGTTGDASSLEVLPTGASKALSLKQLQQAQYSVAFNDADPTGTISSASNFNAALQTNNSAILLPQGTYDLSGNAFGIPQGSTIFGYNVWLKNIYYMGGLSNTSTVEKGPTNAWISNGYSTSWQTFLFSATINPSNSTQAYSTIGHNIDVLHNDPAAVSKQVIASHTRILFEGSATNPGTIYGQNINAIVPNGSDAFIVGQEVDVTNNGLYNQTNTNVFKYGTKIITKGNTNSNIALTIDGESGQSSNWDTGISLGASRLNYWAWVLTPSSGESYTAPGSELAGVSNTGVYTGKVQAAGASNSRTFNDWAADFYSIRNNGAVGDGSTDDSAAVQAAISAANPFGVFTKGNYKLSSTIYLNNGQTNLWLPGAKYTGGLVLGTTDAQVFGTCFGVSGVPVDTGGSPFVFTVQGHGQGTNAAASEVGAFYINYLHDSDSASYDKDGIGLQITSTLDSSISHGRLFGADIQVTVPTGADAFTPALEIAITNDGVSQPNIDQTNSKMLLHLLAAGNNNLTAAAIIDKAPSQSAQFQDGIVFKQGAFIGNSHVWSLRENGQVASTGDIAFLDSAGNLVAKTVYSDVSLSKVATSKSPTVRTLADRFSEVIDVLDEGAVNDGTTDNTTPFNNALNRASVPGAYYISSGKWNVTYAPTPTATTPVCFMLGANLLGNGFIEGNVDGEALGNVTGQNSSGSAFIQALGDGYNQQVLTVQSLMPDWTGTTSVQKNGIYVAVQNKQVSDAAGSTPYTKDTVAYAANAQIGPSNPQGRIWGGDFAVYCPSGSDGQMTGLEISVQNHGSTVGTVGGAFGKVGIGVYSQGSINAASGIEIGSGFTYGLTFLGNNGTYCWQAIDGSGVIISYLDILGNLFTDTTRTKAFTVATLPSGQEGMRAYVTDATNPTFLGPLTGGGSVKCPAFHNGTSWVAG